jgi:hypothetical protein
LVRRFGINPPILIHVDGQGNRATHLVEGSILFSL